MGDAEDLAIELHEVWIVANSCDDLADAHESAKSAVAGCSPASALNDRADLIGLDTAVADAWNAARDQLLGALGTNATSCSDTATALRLTIQHFTSTDDAVRAELNGLKERIPYE